MTATNMCSNFGGFRLNLINVPAALKFLFLQDCNMDTQAMTRNNCVRV